MQKLETDYLVIGCGAVAMSFVDTLLDEAPDASIIIVDNHHQPGGHWNDAYPFVRLHQPSHFYGVSSTPLGSKHLDQVGSNSGHYELATGHEVQVYFEQVMRQRLLPSGRVQYFPMCESQWGSDTDTQAQFRHTLSGEQYEVSVAKRIVDSTYFRTSVPSRHKRNFAVATQATCVAPNDLPNLAPNFEHFCILGAGKTAMDAGVWLLDNQCSPDNISWVCPRQSWLVNRAVTQLSVDFFKETVGGFADQLEAIATATSIDDCFDKLEACDYMLRIDESQRPTMFHFATISKGEVAQLKRLTNIISQGRVKAIEADSLIMENGQEIAMQLNTLYIDCTASAVNFKTEQKRPVFEDGLITIQGLRIPNPCLSAAICAYIEANFDDDETRNALSTPVALPDNPVMWLQTTLGNMMNQGSWSTKPELDRWISHNRLDGFSAVLRDADLSDPTNKAMADKLGANILPAIVNLQKLIESS